MPGLSSLYALEASTSALFELPGGIVGTILRNMKDLHRLTHCTTRRGVNGDGDHKDTDHQSRRELTGTVSVLIRKPPRMADDWRTFPWISRLCDGTKVRPQDGSTIRSQ